MAARLGPATSNLNNTARAIEVAGTNLAVTWETWLGGFKNPVKSPRPLLDLWHQCPSEYEPVLLQECPATAWLRDAISRAREPNGGSVKLGADGPEACQPVRRADPAIRLQGYQVEAPARTNPSS
jgi:hypothetical protein